jgi:pyrroline-5-carboxylate reductase
MSQKIIGIIGFGNMGSAIAEQLKERYQIFCFDKDKSKTEKLNDLNIAKDIVGLTKKVDTVIIAIKPQDFGIILNEIKDSVQGKLVISIAAGITTGFIEKYLENVRVVRTMPNMPARIGEGMTCICKGKFATDEDLNFVEELFGYLGRTISLNEGMMDAATAISGSGPGYYFDIVESHQKEYKDNPNKILKDFINSLAEAAEGIGFSKEEARLLAMNTGPASQLLLEKTKLSPQDLKKQITSKGGTTEAGLEVLHKDGSLIEAVKAALKRAKELSKK